MALPGEQPAGTHTLETLAKGPTLSGLAVLGCFERSGVSLAEPASTHPRTELTVMDRASHEKKKVSTLVRCWQESESAGYTPLPAPCALPRTVFTNRSWNSLAHKPAKQCWPLHCSRTTAQRSSLLSTCSHGAKIQSSHRNQSLPLANLMIINSTNTGAVHTAIATKKAMPGQISSWWHASNGGCTAPAPNSLGYEGVPRHPTDRDPDWLRSARPASSCHRHALSDRTHPDHR